MLDLARDSPMVQRCFDLTSVQQVIKTEIDEQGLERIRIVLTYSKVADAWHRRFNPEAMIKAAATAS